VWVLEGGSHKALVQVDPRANRVARTIRLPDVLTPAMIAVGERRVWLVQQTSPGSSVGSLWQYDPRAGSLAPAAFGAGVYDAVAVGAGAVWLDGYTLGSIGLLRVRADGRSLGYVACSCNVPVFGEGAAWADRIVPSF